MNLKVKRLVEDAVLPKYANYGDAGMDLTAVNKIKTELYNEYLIGIAVEIPKGYVGLVFPRSSISDKRSLMANSVGVIDSSYRGELKVRMREVGTNEYGIGDKVGQLLIMPIPEVIVEEVKELTPTDRGEGGFGSTGM